MIFQQYYVDCLSHASFLIGDETTHRAVVVDPQRDVSQYLTDAAQLGLTIERVIETHFHADFVSGHLEIQAATGAAISFGPGAQTEYPIENLEDLSRIELGEVILEIRHTPGHTPESICVVIYENSEGGPPFGVLTGDTLFIGDVGRPDLLAANGFTARDLATQLYYSLHNKLLTLPHSTKVFPAHGAGSACGKQLSAETVSTIGDQLANNYALAPMSATTFVDRVCEFQSTPPPYFAHDVMQNRAARAPLDVSTSINLVSFDGLCIAKTRGAVVLDTRSDTDFAQGHIRGSINVGLGGRFSETCGDVIDANAAIVLVGNIGTEAEARLRLSRIGFDNVVGALAGGTTQFQDHADLINVASRISGTQLESLRASQAIQIVDVRGFFETEQGMIDGAIAIPLIELIKRIPELDPTLPTVVNCVGGYRSSTAASVMRASGFIDVSDLLGGYPAWLKATS